MLHVARLAVSFFTQTSYVAALDGVTNANISVTLLPSSEAVLRGVDLVTALLAGRWQMQYPVVQGQATAVPLT